ncbi:MAG TPA: glycosyltransferase family 39 protein [Pyrinomonadaceae bacterium]
MNQAALTTITPETAENLSTHQASTTTAGQDLPFSFWRTWRWWLPPAIIALVLVLFFVDPFIGDWDGLDYTMLSIAGYPSSMALGRNLFIFGNYALYEIARFLFNIQPEQAYLIFKYAVVAQAPLAVVAVWILARDVTDSVHAATVACLTIALSPVFVLYGGQVMTDVPSLLLLSVALIIHLRGIQQDRVWLIVVGAALLGLGVNLRETVGFYLPWLILAPLLLNKRVGRREIVLVLVSVAVFFIFALSWFLYWFLTDPHYRFIWFGWRESLAQESARHPVSIRNLLPFFMYFFFGAPVVFLALPFAVISEIRKRRLNALLLLALVGLFANSLLFFNYSTAVNWRYFLTGLPALSPIVAFFLIRKLTRKFGSVQRAFLTCIAVIVAFAGVFSIYARPVSKEFIQRRAMSRDYRYQLVNVPPDAVMISGAQTIAVTYWKAMGLGQWKTIGTGGGWPGDNLVPEIERYLNTGKRVFLDSDPRWWLPCGWQRSEIAPIVALETRFRFQKVTDTIFEIRPQNDPTANDDPHLERLLPENRPEDTKKCSPGSS